MSKRFDSIQLQENLLRFIRREGSVTAKATCAELNISQPVISRLVTKLKK